MKYAVLVGDGMADFPVKELGDKTPLAFAQTPHMDRLMSRGRGGRVSTVPQGMSPGSDVANMSLMGYDPARYLEGRAPIEAASMGISLSEGQSAFRCNLVTLDEGRMDDYSAGHIESADAAALIDLLQKRLGSRTVRFYPGVSYRHLVVIDGFDSSGLRCTPPHDISGTPVQPHLPRGNGDGPARLRELMELARAVLAESPVNHARIEAGKKPATDIWLWGRGGPLRLPTLTERYSLRGAVVSAVDLVRGLGVLAGLRAMEVEGATGYLDTNYRGKVDAAREALEEGDFVYLHVEAPDETSHEGDCSKKLAAIEAFDAQIVGPMSAVMEGFGAYRILCAPDHATPLSMRTHHAMPVPYALCGSGIEAGVTPSFCEAAVERADVVVAPALFEEFITSPVKR